MAIRLPQTRLVPGGALRTMAEQSMAKPPTEGVVPGSALREMVTSPIIGGEPAGSQKTFSVRPEVNPAAGLTSPAMAGGAGNVVPAAPAYVPPAPAAPGLPTAEEARSIIQDAISSVTGSPSQIASNMAPSGGGQPSQPGRILGATASGGTARPISVSTSMVSPSANKPAGVTPLNNPGGGGGMPGRNILGSPVIGSTGGANSGGGGSLFPQAMAVGTGIANKVKQNIGPVLTSIASKAPAALDFLSRFIPSPLRIPFLMPNLPGSKKGGVA